MGSRGNVRKAEGSGPLNKRERSLIRVVNEGYSIMEAGAMADDALELAARGNIPAFMAKLPWEEAARKYAETAEPMADAIKAKATGDFTTIDALSRKYAGEQSATLVKNITRAQQNTLRGILYEAQDGALTVDQTARRIKQVIGLHPAWAQAVVNYRDRMLANPEPGYSLTRWQQTVEARTDRYAKRLVAKRAMNIARTEIMTAENLGRYATMAAAVRDGFAAPNSLKEWAPGPGACENCRKRAGETVPWNHTFSNGVMIPPAHVGCRCTVVFRPVDSNRVKSPGIDWLGGGNQNPAPLDVDDLFPIDVSSVPKLTEPLTLDEASEFFNTKAVRGTDDEYNVAGLYKAGMQWNDWLRAGNIPNEYAKEQIDTLAGFIDKQPMFEAPITVYRGLSKSRLPDLNPGVTFKDEGFMSTSLDPKVASKFAGTGTSQSGYTPILQIEARAGDKGLPMNVVRHPDQSGIPEPYRQAPSVLGGESEILLPPGTTLQVVSVEQGRLGGWTHMIVKAVVVDG